MFTSGTEGSVLGSKPYIFPSDHQVVLQSVFTGGTEGLVLRSKPYIFPSDHQVALCLQVEQRAQCSALSPTLFF